MNELEGPTDGNGDKVPPIEYWHVPGFWWVYRICVWFGKRKELRETMKGDDDG